MHVVSKFLIYVFTFLPVASLHAQNVTADPYHYQIKKYIQCKNGAVVSAHPLASEVGLQMLKKGGNAF